MDDLEAIRLLIYRNLFGTVIEHDLQCLTLAKGSVYVIINHSLARHYRFPYRYSDLPLH
jgi:hypothetical protein